MTTGNVGSSGANPEDVRAVYGALLARSQAIGATTWQVIGLSVAAEAGLWVALAQVRGAFQVLIGLGLLMVAGIAALVIRFTELSYMLDRQMLSQYEESLNIGPNLQLHHDMRFEDRMLAVSRQLTPARRERLFKRRIAKSLPGNAGPLPALWRLDRALSTLGQPSMVFTALLSFSGAVGFGVGLHEASDSFKVSIPLTLLALFGLCFPWFASMNNGIGTRLRKALRRLLP